MQTQTRRVAIVGGNRIPFARSNTHYATASNQEMLTAAIDGLVDRFGLAGEAVGEVVAGAVLKHSRDFNLTREAVLGSKLAPETPATDIQQACGTGLEAAILVANKIALGQIDCAIAGGVDTTSDAPLGVNEEARKVFMALNRAKTNGERAKLGLKLLNPKSLMPDIPKNGEPRIVSFFAKQARGAMARFICENRITDPAALADFNLGGYEHRPDMSAPDRPVFVRGEVDQDAA